MCAEASSFLAFDFGAESGRAVLGRLSGGRLSLREIHRFVNEPVHLPDGLHWDTPRFQHEMEAGLAKAAREGGRDLAGMAVDTWGVDFGLLSSEGVLLGEPFHYRDHRTDGIFDKAFAVVPREEIYRQTGIQFMPFNTIFQFLAMGLSKSPLLPCTETMLFMPGLLTYYLTGERCNDFSISTTSQCYDPRTHDWAWGLIEKFGLPHRLFAPVVNPGTIIGDLQDDIAERTGVRGRVIAVAGHDTASAVAAVPAEEDDFAYISCGTWSLMGVELPSPLIDERTLEAGLTNEGGVGGTIRLLKNIMGLWLVQECRRSWARSGRAHDYGELTSLAAEARGFKTLIDPDDPAFLNPGDMPAAIREYALATGQDAPETEGEFVRCALESLALKCRLTLEMLEGVLGRKIKALHMVGGGIQNELLCRLTADATDVPVIAGPVEATAIGNILVQAMALGLIRDLDEARAVIRRSFAPRVYEPAAGGAWEDAYGRFRRLMR